VLAEKKHRATLTDFGRQLHEKQKVRNTYGLSEKQFSNYVKESSGKQGVSPSEYLFEVLESRLDNAVFRAGIASARSVARQMVNHGHIIVNGRRTNIPSRRLKIGDVFAVRDESKKTKLFEGVGEKLKHAAPPVTWIKIDGDKQDAHFQGKPKVGQVEQSFNFTAIIEFYSR
jgi:small subunit ribosomal protein S4